MLRVEKIGFVVSIMMRCPCVTEIVSFERYRHRFGQQRENLHVGVYRRVFTETIGFLLRAVGRKGIVTRANANKGVIHRVIRCEETALADIEVAAGCTVKQSVCRGDVITLLIEYRNVEYD